jgi:hypothetical protein
MYYGNREDMVWFATNFSSYPNLEALLVYVIEA